MARRNKPRSIVDGEECECLISAKITKSAKVIYNQWRDERLGGAKISRAIINAEKDRAIHAENMSEIRALQRENAELRVMLRNAQRQRREFAPLAAEIRDLYTPQRPPIDE